MSTPLSVQLEHIMERARARADFDVEQALLQVLEASACVWDEAIHPLISFGRARPAQPSIGALVESLPGYTYVCAHVGERDVAICVRAKDGAVVWETEDVGATVRRVPSDHHAVILPRAVYHAMKADISRLVGSLTTTDPDELEREWRLSAQVAARLHAWEDPLFITILRLDKDKIGTL